MEITETYLNKLRTMDPNTAKAEIQKLSKDDQLSVITKLTEGDEDFCCNCSYWRETSNGYGICEKENAPTYKRETNAADACEDPLIGICHEILMTLL